MDEIISGEQIRAAAKGKVNADNMNSVLVALGLYGEELGMDKPHIVAQFLAHIMHESGDFQYDGKIWGNPRPQQVGEPGRYRRSLGRSTAARTASLTGSTATAELPSCCSAIAPTMCGSFRWIIASRSTVTWVRRRVRRCTRRLSRSCPARRKSRR